MKPLDRQITAGGDSIQSHGPGGTLRSLSDHRPTSLPFGGSHPETEEVFQQAPKAFALAELLIAVVIFSLAIIPVLDLLIGSARQARQTSDYGLAVALGEKVSEELRLANWENVHFSETLLSDKQYAGRRSVVNAGSPFFGVIEDGAPPFGRIRPGEDPAITSGFGTLYSELAPFFVGTDPRTRSLAQGGTVVDVGLIVEWNDFKGSGAKSPVAVSLSCHGFPPVPPPEVEDRARADDAIRTTLFPDLTGRTLDQVASETGADSKLLRDLGDVVTVVTGMSALGAQITSQVTNLEARLVRASNTSDQSELCLELARLHEKSASAYMSAMIYLKGPISTLESSFELRRLGNKPPDPARYRSAFQSLDSLRSKFGFHLASARAVYAKAYSGEIGRALVPRARVRVFMKVLSLRQLEVLTAGPQDSSSLKTMLVDFMEYYEGRNPNFYRFAEYELTQHGDIPSLRQSYPVPDRLLAYETFRDSVGKTAERITNAGF